MADLKITGVETFVTHPGRYALVVVKVTTSEPGLHGLGCATFTQRWAAVQAAIDRHVGPLVIGRDPRPIEDLWRVMTMGGYWRHGPVLSNAVAGIDTALWDIKGKLAGLPCYELWGGKSRPAAAIYAHANADSPEALADQARAYVEQGVRFVRCQLGGYAGLDGDRQAHPDGAPPGAYFDPREKLRRIPDLFEYLRNELGGDVELIYDVHERLDPTDAVWLAKALEPWRLFFLEDPLAPEDAAHLARLRAACATPIAMGELWTSAGEATPLVTGRLIDFVLCHISAIGGPTAALKLAHLAEPFGVRTAWHGPSDVSPVGMAAAVHLDVTVHNFGIQEWKSRREAERDVFPGMPEVHDGYAWPSDRPGLGIEFDEGLAAKFAPDDAAPDWTEARRPDGGIARP